jgi:glycosyl transferase family 25
MIKALTDRTIGSLNEAFPHKVCINLDRRPDRWQRMQLKFAEHGIQSVRRFSALDGDVLDIPAHWIHTPGAYGCLLSHLEVIREARQLGVSSVLIFEDDVVFDPNLQEKFGTFIEEVPSDWDMLFLGALHKDKPIRIAEHVARISKANSTYAYALRSTVFDDFIELNRKAEEVLDINSFVLQQRFNCYCFVPNLAWVEAEYSDVQKRLERHWYLEKSLVLFGTQVDRLLSDTTIVFAHKDYTGTGRATENLMFLVDYYDEFFSPFISIVIVEQGAKPAIDSAKLPENCKYIFLPDEGPLNRARCFNTGIASSDAERKLFILSDNDLYLETLDIRANLIMCAEGYDGANGFSNVIDLAQEESLRLRGTKTTRGIDITEHGIAVNNGAQSYCSFFTRDALETLGGWHESLLSGLVSVQAKPRRIFQSPNHALRLQ